MDIVHAYHCYAGGAWRDVLAEHLWSLNRWGFDGPTILGLVGRAEDRAEARAAFTAARPQTQVVEADAGFEQVTLDAVHAHACAHDGAVLYAHTKGASRPGGWQDRWRRSMTRDVVGAARNATQHLDHHDAVGSHWLTASDYASVRHASRIGPHFAGNFWLARCDYLRLLPVCSRADRWEAEWWIGIGTPRILDLRPGWPQETCRPPLGVGRLIVPTKGGTSP